MSQYIDLSRNYIILNALKQYDENKYKYKILFDKVKYYRIHEMPKENELDHDFFIFYDKNKKELFRSRFEKIGIHTKEENVFIWNWSKSVKKNDAVLGKKLLNYAIDLGEEYQGLREYFTTSRTRLRSLVDFDIMLASALYLVKNQFHVAIPYPKYIPEIKENNEKIDGNNVDELIQYKESDNDIVYYMYLYDYPEELIKKLLK